MFKIIFLELLPWVTKSLPFHPGYIRILFSRFVSGVVVWRVSLRLVGTLILLLNNVQEILFCLKIDFSPWVIKMRIFS